MAKNNYTPTMCPVGEARYPKLDKPDTKGEYADNKYKVEVVLNSINEKQYTQELMAVAQSMFPGVKNVRIPRKVAKDGTISFIFKSTSKPLLVDAKRQALPEGSVIGGGSKIRVAGSLAKYEKGPNKGITAYLNAVQVIELQQGSSAAMFDVVEDGFDASTLDTPAAASFDTDAAGQNELAL